MRHMQNSLLQDTTHTDYKLFRIYITTFFRGWMTNNLAAESKNIFLYVGAYHFPHPHLSTTFFRIWMANNLARENKNNIFLFFLFVRGSLPSIFTPILTLKLTPASRRKTDSFEGQAYQAIVTLLPSL